MVVEVAKSMDNFGAHYDEMADKKQFHQEQPLTNYQKIVDEVDFEPTIGVSTISLQAQLKDNAQSETKNQQVPKTQEEPKSQQAPKINEEPKPQVAS